MTIGRGISSANAGAFIALACACASSNPGVDAGVVVDAGADAAGSTCTEAELSKCDYPQKGFAVGEVEGISVTDPSTGRVLPLLARFPKATASPLPVVIWSHGGGFNDGGHRLSKEWGTTLAGQGYAVIHIAHVTLTTDTGAAICSLVGVPKNECVADGGDDDGPIVALGKALDLAAVVDKLDTLSAESAKRGGPSLDVTKVVTGGWSGGSRGPMVLMGATTKVSASAPVFSKPEKRIVAAIGLSTSGPGFGGFYDDGSVTSWTNMRGPYLMLTGTNDVKPTKPELTGLIRRFPFTAQPADGQRKLLYSNLPVGVGGHPTYNLEDLTSTDERVVRLSRAIRSSVLAFFDAHARGDASAVAWLATNNAKVLAGDVDWQTR